MTDAVITSTSVTFADRVWMGGVGDWYDAANWSTTTPDQNSYPLPGDSATIGSGTAMLLGAEAKDAGHFDANDVTLGSAASSATLAFVQASLDPLFKITTAGDAEILSTGTSKFSGTLTAAGGSTLTLASETAGTDAGGLIFNQAGFVVSGNQTVEIDGNVTFEAHSGNVTESLNGNAPLQDDQASISLPGSVVNNGTVTTIQQYVEIGGALAGTGTYNLRFETTLNAEGAVSSGQTISFGQGDGRLDIGDLADFAGKITNFSSGNFIDLSNVQFDPKLFPDASYDAASQTLTISSIGGTVAQVQNVQAAPGQLVASSDGGNGTLIGYADSPSSVDISAADRAMGSDVVRATDKVPGTNTPIDGSGIKIGIISDSFDRRGAADANAAAGYLPANPDGTSAVTVLKENPTDGEDEGQAMAELVHQVAPGAKLYFAEDGIDETDFAGSVAQLKAAGCQIIVDDVSFFTEAQHQITGTLSNAISAAVGSGTNYFTSAGNDRDTFLEQAFAPSSVTLSDGSAVQAHVFSNGTAYEPVRIRGGANIEVQWSAPYEGVNGTGAPNALQAKLFDAAGNLVATSTQVIDDNGIATADADLFVPNDVDYGIYKLSVYGTDGVAPPPAFSVYVSGAGHAAIYDPAAGEGSGDIVGKDLIPGVNTVGAAFYGDSPAFGQAPSSEFFSSYGPGELTYDSQGNPLPTPVTLAKPDFSAPDGVTTSLSPFQPFFGTSAAAPDAAAVGALVLQADGRLINTQVSYLLKQSAIPFGNPAQSGAGLIQADTAVAGAITAATTPIWTGQAGTTSWTDAGNWSDNRTPGETDDVTIGNGIGAIGGAYSVVYDLASGTIGSLLIDGASALAPTATPTFSIAAGASLSALSVSVGTGAVDLAGALQIDGGSDSKGAITFNGTTASQAVLTLAALAQPFQAGQFDGTLDDFGDGDALDLASLSDATVAYLDGTMTVSGLDPVSHQVRVERFTLTDPGASAYFAHDDGHSGTLVDDVPVCFAAGTAIRLLQDGRAHDVAVEDLQVGDRVVTGSGTMRPIRWLGHRRIDCRRHPRPHEVLPVRIAAHAFGEAHPARALLVSPGHAVCVDVIGEVLIPAIALVDGSTIQQVDVDEVTYWHVELDSHDVVLAEGLPAESYLEMGNRSFFAENGTVSLAASPDASKHTHADFCRPFVADGPVIEAVKARLKKRAVRQAAASCGRVAAVA